MDKKYKAKLFKIHQQYLDQVSHAIPKEQKIPTILQNDPMSPYINPVSKLTFTSLTDEINTRSFKAVYPQSYTPVSRYFTETNTTPFFNPGIDSDYAKGAITIAGMIDLVYLKQPWALVNIEDFNIIINLTTQYLQLFTKENNTSNNYKPRVERFLSVIEKGRIRAYRQQHKDKDLKLKDVKYYLNDFIH